MLTAVLERWAEHFDSAATPRQRKLLALGLCAAVAVAPAAVGANPLDALVACITGKGVGVILTALNRGLRKGERGGNQYKP